MVHWRDTTRQAVARVVQDRFAITRLRSMAKGEILILPRSRLKQRLEDLLPTASRAGCNVGGVVLSFAQMKRSDGGNAPGCLTSLAVPVPSTSVSRIGAPPRLTVFSRCATPHVRRRPASAWASIGISIWSPVTSLSAQHRDAPNLDRFAGSRYAESATSSPPGGLPPSPCTTASKSYLRRLR